MKEKIDRTNIGHALGAVPWHTCAGSTDKNKPVTFHEGTLLLLRSVEIADKSPNKSDEMVWITMLSGQRVLVRKRDFAWHIGQIPDFQVSYYLVGHGYQVNYANGYQPLAIECRDFSGSYKIPKLVDKIFKLCRDATEKFRKAL